MTIKSNIKYFANAIKFAKPEVKQMVTEVARLFNDRIIHKFITAEDIINKLTSGHKTSMAKGIKLLSALDNKKPVEGLIAQTERKVQEIKKHNEEYEKNWEDELVKNPFEGRRLIRDKKKPPTLYTETKNNIYMKMPTFFVRGDITYHTTYEVKTKLKNGEDYSYYKKQTSHLENIRKPIQAKDKKDAIDKFFEYEYDAIENTQDGYTV